MLLLGRAWAAISKSSALQTFGKNSAIQTGEQLINVILGLIVTLYLARQLGPSLFGIWSLCIALLRLAMAALSYGLETIILRHCSGHTLPDESFLTSVVVLRTLNSLTILAGALFGIYLLPAENPTMVNLTLVMLPALLVLPFEGLEFWFRATKDAVVPAIARTISVIAGSAFKIGFVASGAALVYVGAAHAVQIGLFGLILLYYYLRRGHRFQFDTQALHRIRNLYREAWPLFVTTLGYLVYARVDIVMLSWLQGDRVVGTYAAAVRIAEVANLAPVILMTAASPFIFNGMRNNVKNFSELFHVFLTALNIFFVLIAIVVFFLAPFAINLLFGDAYGESAGFLSIYIFSTIFVAQGLASQYWWIARRRHKVVMWRALTGAIINIALNALLIPAYGGYGAAIATVASQFFASVGINIFFGRNGWYLLRMQLIPKLRLSGKLNLDDLVANPHQVIVSSSARSK